MPRGARLLLTAAALTGARCGTRGALEAVLHVGPHKTGSTTLEAATLVLPGVRNLLINRDSFALAHDMPGKYVGAKAHANLADALLSPDMLSHPTWPWFVAYARKSHAAGKRLFITTENLSVVPSVPNLRRLLSTLSAGIGYRVRVVVIHRRLFDKLPSVHSELYMAEYRPILAVREYLPIVDWIVQRDAHVSSRFYQTVRLRNQFAGLGAAEVSVMNIHRLPAGASLTAEFVCNHLRANFTCSRLRSRGAPKVLLKNARPRGMSTLFDLIYGAARAAGIARLRPDRALAVLAEHGADARTRPQIPFRCLNQTVLKGIWRAALGEERALHGAAPFRERERAELRDMYEAKVRDLCSADVGVALRMAQWAQPLKAALEAGRVDAPAQ